MPRRRHDFYETPPHYVKALLDRITVAHHHVYEPCVGRGHISNALVKAHATVTTNDIDERFFGTTHYDATMLTAWRQRYDWVITNPPFRQEEAILRYALQHADHVAFLARLSFLEPTQSRARFWKLCQAKYGMPSVIVLPRYSFRNNDEGKRQTDSVTCCWLVWSALMKPGLRISLLREP